MIDQHFYIDNVRKNICQSIMKSMSPWTFHFHQILKRPNQTQKNKYRHNFFFKYNWKKKKKYWISLEKAVTDFSPFPQVSCWNKNFIYEQTLNFNPNTLIYLTLDYYWLNKFVIKREIVIKFRKKAFFSVNLQENMIENTFLYRFQ